MRCGEESSEGSQGVSDSKEQRSMMAADLWSRAAKRALEGEHESAMRISDRATMLLSNPVDALIHYRNGLHIAGSSADDAQAAVAAILAGRHPADSLPGQVLAQRKDAARRASACVPFYDAAGSGPRWAGHVHAYDHVLTLLGCKVTP
jgi:hypothetical protein